VKQPRPLPTAPPFLTLYTATYLRPVALARNMASVGRQTATGDIEQLVLPDHVGYGLVNGLYGRITWYADACRGDYVAFLSDDDELAGENVVAALKVFADKRGRPEVISVRVKKGREEFPKSDPTAEPIEGDVDLGTFVMRRDVWLAHKSDFGLRYQGDYDLAVAMWKAKRQIVPMDLLFAFGPAGGGRPELSL